MLRYLSFCAVLAVCALVFSHGALAQSRQELEAARRRMVEEAVEGAGVTNEKVIESMLATPRHEFVAAQYRAQAYFDMSLPIGESQTISSPFIVAYMTQLLDPQPTDVVLEIGTGSGYQAAILSPLVKEVYTIEIVDELGRRAERTLKRLRYDNVHAKVGDGYKGWEEHAPYDKIIVTCSPEKVPVPLVRQLREGGRLVIPVGERYQQTLYVMKKENGTLTAEAMRPTLFVPMTGAAEARREKQPDPANPEIANSGFEQDATEDGFMPGWYYQRQLEWVTDIGSPGGEHHILFKNTTAGRHAHLLQGFAVDGREVKELEIAGWVKTKDVVSGQTRGELPSIAVSFFDEERRDLGSYIAGPFAGTQDWNEIRRRCRVPLSAREAILRVGLFGGTGEVRFDEVKVTAVKN